MKPPFFTVLLLLCLLAGTVSLRAETPPALPIDRALGLAQHALADKGVKDVYIQSISLLHPTIVSGKAVWQVLWSGVVPGSKENSQEVGVEIGMSGDVIHLLRGPGGLQKPFLAH